MYILNIGLFIKKTNKKNSYIKNIKLIFKLIPRIKYIIKRNDTIIVYFNGKIQHSNILRLSYYLKQYCIAFYDCVKNVGKLIGTKSKTWGYFEIEKFIFY